MSIQTYATRRPRHGAVDPADVEYIMSDEESHMAVVNTARTVMRVLAPMLIANADRHPLYLKILNDLIKRHMTAVTHSAVRQGNKFYRGTVIIRMGDLHYWGVPNRGSVWYEGEMAA